ncbi:hypothetical protein BH24GEM1_BH24GEM1_20720 [soil metagenome]
MAFKHRNWYPIAVGLGALNLLGAGAAAGAAEPWHAAVHVGLALASGWWARRLRRDLGTSELQDRLEGLESLEFEVSNLRQELSETQERLDFAERLLAGPERAEWARNAGRSEPKEG